jgi:nucleoside-diphosphate-sugar epimerase
MRILLTGCSGYIGRQLASRFKNGGHQVIGLDRNPCDGLPLDDFIQCDLLEWTRYRHALSNVDQVCHLAAAKGDWGISDAEYHRDNVEVTRVLLDTAARANVRRWFFYSSVSALGPSNVPLGEGAPRRPANAYGRSKAACEALFEEYVAQTTDARVVIIRPSVVFGPSNPRNTNVFRLIDAIYRKRFIMIGHGRDVKTTSYIDNLLDAHVFLLQRQIAGHMGACEVFHYVDAPGDTTAALVHRIYDCLGMKPARLYLPIAVAVPIALVGDVAAALSGRDVPITSARVRKFCTATNFSADAIRELGFVQNISNQEAIRRTVDWYLQAGMPSAA